MKNFAVTETNSLLSRMIKSAIKFGYIPERDGTITEGLINGLSVKDLAEKNCLSSERIKQISDRVFRKLNHFFVALENENAKLTEKNLKLTGQISMLNLMINDLKAGEINTYVEKAFLIPVRGVGFSIRVLNICRIVDIDNLGELISLSANEFTSIRSSGEKSLNEVREVLKKYKLKLKGD